MTDSTDNISPQSEAEADIWNAISAFEKILEAIPNDRVSLEALADAYEQVGDHTRARDYILRLARVLIDEDDEEAARDLLRKIKSFAEGDPEAAALVSEIEGFRTKKIMVDVIDPDDMAAPRSTNLSDEIAFAWNLFQNNKLTQEEYSNVVQDLTESSSRQQTSPVSTLHALNDRSFKNITDVMLFVAKDCGAPILSLSNFELLPDVTSLLTHDFCLKRKALAFDLIGSDMLVAVLNPYDAQLQNDIETLTGHKCHFFLVWPEDFDAALIKKQQNESKQESET